jgi:hypothetical protein
LVPERHGAGGASSPRFALEHRRARGIGANENELEERSGEAGDRADDLRGKYNDADERLGEERQRAARRRKRALQLFELGAQA